MYSQASAHGKRQAAECLLYKRSSKVSEVHAGRTQHGDAWKLFGGEGRSTTYKSQKVALSPELEILQQPFGSVSYILEIRKLFQRCVLPSIEY